MAAHVVIYGSKQGVGHEDLVAVVIDDGDETIVLGDSDIAEDLREAADEVEGDDSDTRLANLCGGLSYFRTVGPTAFAGSAADAAAPLAALFGLPSA